MACDDTAKNAVELDVDFKWNPPCTILFVRPKITIRNVPAGTVKYYVEMTDLDLPAFDHGSGYVKHENDGIIPAGAVRGSYAGPSPPYGVINTYEIKVKALSSNSDVLGVGKMSHRYPPKGEEEVRWSPCGNNKK